VFRRLTAIRSRPTPAVGLLLAASFAGCAQIEPPSGGPEDRTNPSVLASFPESMAVGVGAVDTLSLEFSEAMDKKSVEDWLFLTPETGRMRLSWEGGRLFVHLETPLRDETTYTLFLGSQMTDRRDNPLAFPVLIPFATGDQMDAGGIAGKVTTGRLEPAGHFVFAWEGEPAFADSVPAPPGGIEQAIRRGQSDGEGIFELGPLPLGKPLTVCAFYDAEGNRSFDPKTDLWGCLPISVTLADTVSRISGVELFLVYPEEPGTLEGIVLDSLCLARMAPSAVRARTDSLLGIASGLRPDTTSGGPAGRGPAWDEWERGEADTPSGQGDGPPAVGVDSLLSVLQSRLETARSESVYCAKPVWVEAYAGDSLAAAVRVADAFTVTGLAPGRYRLRAYRDLDLSGDWNEGEPQSADTVPLDLPPARTVAEVEIPLPALPKPWPEVLSPAPTDTAAAPAEEGP